MKVTGPNLGPGAQAPDPTEGSQNAADAAGGAQGKSKVGAGPETTAAGPAEGGGQVFAERLAASGAPPLAAPAGGATRPGATAAIAADLEAGRLGPRAAVEQVLEQVLARQLGADAPPEMREKLRAALADALENDPLLAEKVRRLTG